MIINYFKIALRSLLKQKGYSLINITGLSVALAVTLLMLTWVQMEWITDKYHSKGERIYRIQRVLPLEGNKLFVNNNLPYPLLQAIEAEIPEVEKVLPIGYNSERLLERGKRAFRERGSFGNAALFESFSYPILAGDIKQLDEKINSIAISENLAKKLFGDSWRNESIGQNIAIEDMEEHSVELVFANMPENSSVKYEYFFNIKSHLKQNDWLLEWGNNAMAGAFLLADGANLQSAQEKIVALYKKSEVYEEGENIRFQKYADHYLYGTFDEKAQVAGGRIEYLRTIGIAALFLLLISCINFVNLATARASKRAKEVGVRKSIGATKSSLMVQFMVEAAVITTISVGAGILLAEMLLPFVRNITEKMLDFQYGQLSFWIGIFLIITSTTILSGAYPSFVLSAFQPVRVLKGRTNQSFGKVSFRKGLVVLQFVLALLLIVGAVIIQQQIQYIQNKNLGLDKDNRIFIPKDQKISEKYDLLKNNLMQQPGIVSVVSTSHSPIEVQASTSGVQWPGKRPDQSHQEFSMLWTEDNFLEAFNIPLIDGQFYMDGTTIDTTHLVVNQKAIELMGLEQPVGSIIQWWGKPRQIIGVVKDFHIESLYKPIEPMAILLDKENTWSLFVEMHPGKMERALSGLESTFKEILPESHLYYEFVDEQHQKNYKSEVLIGKLANYFALISIFISCLGLLGLATFLAEQKTKEIGIRKVLGASVTNLVALLSKEFLWLTGLGLFIGIPVSWYLLSEWLEKFAYKVELQWWMFAIPVVAAIGIASITVGIQALRAAVVNPIQSLHSE